MKGEGGEEWTRWTEWTGWTGECEVGDLEVDGVGYC